ncbi:chondroitinase family polysaccharide lyase [Zobellia uliginosa]|uniref:chondroitinase family polysaccharide lyase n=1 Tax=Zobellia uliginosa TaxID=143224 RepID=UPI0026E2F387|nr:chondroitinase family polysaccharide lyase [Zobellia uliginosa]MDO6518134.1 chondroitinase family polysaccharide lyase [Zobellia uliginosa]
MKKILSLLLFLTPFLFSVTGYAQAQKHPIKLMESFEEGIPASLSTRGGSLSLDSLRMKQGRKSLRWDWIGNDALIFNTPIGYHAQRDLSKLEPVGRDKFLMNGHSSYDNKEVLEFPRGFFMWVYNEEASTRRLTFQFGRGEVVDCEFEFNLDFVGWRSVSVIYDRGDMRGIPRPDMDRLTILAPTTGSGTYYIDAVGLSLPMNPKTISANPQLPYIKPHTRLVTQYEHRIYEWSHNRPSFQLKELTPNMVTALNDLDEKAEEFILPSYQRENLKDESIDGIVKLYEQFEIRRQGDKIYGRPLVKGNIYPEFFVEMGLGKKFNEGCMTWKEHFSKALMKIAALYRSTQNEQDKVRLEKMFIDLFDYGVDQGFDVGAGLGWIHHYSYEIREVGPAFYLMRDVLDKNNRLEKAIAIMKWFYSFGQVYREDLVYGVKGRTAADADDSQGLLKPRLYSALIMKHSPEKVRDLEHFSSFFSNVTANYANGLDEIYKPDGITFHHAGHAQGYGGRGVDGGVSILYMLSHSPFKASKEAHARMKKITQTLFDCLFTDDFIGPRAFASIRFQNYQLPTPYFNLPALIALSGDEYDEEMAGFYKQLIATKSKPNEADRYWMQKLEKKGAFQTYNYPKSRILSYSTVGIRRENNEWMATVRGHSKYVIPYESWGPNYFAYPTFIAYGYLDVSYPESLDSTTPKSGSWYEGYDWHRWPGVTSVHTPYEQIKTSPGQHRDEGGEYPFSDQGFVGGVESVDGNSVFVFPFKGHDMFNLQSFTGKKSYFFFDDFVVCLGSDIKSGLKSYPVETTIIQDQILPEGKGLLTSNGIISEFPFENSLTKTKPFWLIDNRNTGYYIPNVPKNTTLSIQRKNQTNPQFQDKGMSSGDFTTVLFDHGASPQNAEYQYALVVDADEKKMEEFSTGMKGGNKPYQVIQHNTMAHIVSSPKNATTAYAIYDANAKLKSGLVKSVNRPSIFIVKEEANGVKLAVSDPDLNIYDGQDDLMPDGTRVESSIYEHEWYYWPSRSSKVQLTLKGEWKIKEQIKEMETASNKRASIVSSNKKETVIEFECRDGLSAEVVLAQ